MQLPSTSARQTEQAFTLVSDAVASLRLLLICSFEQDLYTFSMFKLYPL